MTRWLSSQSHPGDLCGWLCFFWGGRAGAPGVSNETEDGAAVRGDCVKPLRKPWYSRFCHYLPFGFRLLGCNILIPLPGHSIEVTLLQRKGHVPPAQGI